MNVQTCESNAVGNESPLASVMFAMRSEPTGGNPLAGALFTMRSEPIDQHCPDSGERA